LKRDAKRHVEVENARSVALKQAEDMLASERDSVKASKVSLQALKTQHETIVAQLKKQSDLLLEAERKNEQVKTSNAQLIAKMEGEMVEAEKARENERVREAQRLHEVEKDREDLSKRLVEREREWEMERKQEKERQSENERKIDTDRERESEREREREKERESARSQFQALEKENLDLRFRLTSLESELSRSLSSPPLLTESVQTAPLQPSSSSSSSTSEEYEELLSKMAHLTAQYETSSSLSQSLKLQVAALEDEIAMREETLKKEALSLRYSRENAFTSLCVMKVLFSYPLHCSVPFCSILSCFNDFLFYSLLCARIAC
jgi:chromosome segregation ATPase